MNALLKIGFGLLASVPMIAFGQVPEGEPSATDAASEVSFSGAPGLAAKAVLVSNSETEPSLVIFHKRPGHGAAETVLENNKLNLSMTGMSGNATSLSVNPSGSLQILSGNQTGPTRWERTLTVSYRGGQYSVTGITLTVQDSYAKKQTNCDYNLLNGQGVHDGKTVSLKTQPIPLAVLTDNPMMTSCEKW